jgi:hypothetical protein
VAQRSPPDTRLGVRFGIAGSKFDSGVVPLLGFFVSAATGALGEKLSSPPLTRPGVRGTEFWGGIVVDLPTSPPFTCGGVTEVAGVVAAGFVGLALSPPFTCGGVTEVAGVVAAGFVGLALSPPFTCGGVTEVAGVLAGVVAAGFVGLALSPPFTCGGVTLPVMRLETMCSPIGSLGVVAHDPSTHRVGRAKFLRLASPCGGRRCVLAVVTSVRPPVCDHCLALQNWILVFFSSGRSLGVASFWETAKVYPSSAQTSSAWPPRRRRCSRQR